MFFSLTQGLPRLVVTSLCTGTLGETQQAKSVDLRSSLAARDLIYKFHEATKIRKEDVLEGSLIPEEPYRLQTIKVRLPKVLTAASKDKSGSIFLGLRTKNYNGTMSKVSNVAPVTWSGATPPRPLKTTARTTKGGNVYGPTSVSPEPYKEQEKGVDFMGILISLLVAAVVVLVAIYGARRRSDDKSTGGAEQEDYGDATS